MAQLMEQWTDANANKEIKAITEWNRYSWKLKMQTKKIRWKEVNSWLFLP